MNALWSTRPDIPMIDRVRIQSEVLVPLIREMRSELGAERANDMLRRCLGPMFRELGRRYYEGAGGEPFEAARAHGEESTAGNAVTYDLRPREDGMEFDVLECQYARFFRELGEPELGFLFVCSSDFGIYEEMPGVELERTQTLMQGASHCDFRYRFLKP